MSKNRKAITEERNDFESTNDVVTFQKVAIDFVGPIQP